MNYLDPLLTLATLAMTGYSLYSGIVYMSRRSDNKEALRSHKEQSAPARSLTEDERAALQPFLVHPLKPHQSIPLSREGVFLLEGPCIRHGLMTTDSGTIVHDTIGGVDVTFPYDARDFLTEYCKAEVVFTDKVAIVVSLEGGFDLLGGRERARLRQLQAQQWKSGRPGAVAELPSAAEPDAEAAVPKEAGAAAKQALQVQILSQRDETPAEMAERSSPGLWLPGFFLILGFAGLRIASAAEASSRGYWLVPALLCWLAALVFIWRKRAVGAPQKVNRVRGELFVVEVPVNGETTAATGRLFIGDKFELKLPNHWREHVLTGQPEPADIDMRVNDHSVLRFDQRLSIDEEARRWQPVFWGHHFGFALVGLLAALALLLYADSVRGDLLLSWSWARQGGEQTFSSASALAAAPPPVGWAVRLGGKARCEVLPDSGQPQIDCHRLRWDGATPESKAPELDGLTLALHSGEFIHARSNPRLDIIMRQLRQQQTWGNDPYRALDSSRPSMDMPKTVSHLLELIRTVRQACEPTQEAPLETARELQSRCGAWRQSLVDALDTTGDQRRDWAAWLKLADEGALAGREVQLVMPASAVSSITSAAGKVADIRIDALRSQVAREILQTQRGGVVLQVVPGEGARLPGHEDRQGHAIETLADLKALTTADSLQDFSVSGLVTRVGQDAHGQLVLDVDASRSLADPLPFLLRSLYLASALLLMVVHGALFFRCGRAAAARMSAIQSFNGQRMAQ